MSIQEFTIPLDKEELINTYFGKYGSQDPVSLLNLNREIKNINLQQLMEADAVDLVQKKLDLFLSVVVHGKRIELPLLIQCFVKFSKILQNVVSDMEKKTEQSQDIEIQSSDKNKLLFANKVLAYVVSSTLCIIEDAVAEISNNNQVLNAGGRGSKRSQQKSDIQEEWDSNREMALEIVQRWLQLPLKNLWSPPIVEDPFIGTVSQICYKVLEKTKNMKDVKSKATQMLIFQILGTLVKKYNHSIAFVLHAIQLTKFHEALSVPMGIGVVSICIEHNCRGLIKEIAREIAQNDISEKDARNFSNFMETIATARPEIVLPILDNIMDYLTDDPYIMRNCAVTILGIVVVNVLTGEGLSADKRIMRDECLDSLVEHILDSNSYVRSKVLQTWQKLCSEGAVPVSRQNQLLQACILRLEDKAANVRKQALQLMRAILENNPFASKMNQEKFSQNLEKVRDELKQLQTKVYHTIGAEEEKEELWNTQLPKIEKAIDGFLEEYSASNDNDNSDDDADSNEENNIDIDIEDTFNKIQNFILKDNCTKAVKYCHNAFHQFGFSKVMRNESEEVKKEALLLFMYKIFMTSKSNNSNNNEEEAEDGASVIKTWIGKLTEADRKEMNQLNALKVKKALVNYLQFSYTFSLQLEASIPIVESLLYSLSPSDAIEACSYLGAAYQFQVTGAPAAIRKALFQIFCSEQSVRDNLLNVYKEIYLKPSNSQMTGRAKSTLAVKALIQLLAEMKPGQSVALSKLIVSWRNSNDLDLEALKIMWEMFTLKFPNTTEEESRSALMLLRMAAASETRFVSDNLHVLIKVGLGSRARTDLLLARDTCRAILAMKEDSKDVDKSPIRYTNDYEMFKQIVNLLIDTFLQDKENGYTSFATDAINVIFQLADQPEKIIQELLLQLARSDNFIRNPDSSNQSPEHSSYSLSRFLYLIGHIGISEMVYLDQSIYKELKRRNAARQFKSEIKTRVANMRNRRMSMNSSFLSNASGSSSINSTLTCASAQRFVRKKKSTEEGEEDMDGVTADDAEADHINMVLEQELMAESGYLRKFVPLILDVCQRPDKYPLEIVQANGALALSKLMTISSEFCEANLQLFVTILERSLYPQIRANIIVGLADLMTRFPNQIDPWTTHIYGRLKDPDLIVRSTCVRILSNLILGEMIRVKGQVAHLALCVVDENEEIRTDTKQLFKDLSHKGNALYNIMPDILSCLSDSQLNLTEADFQNIMSYILGLVQKDRQVDNIVEKLCSRFKLATTERQWRDLSYCLSVLKFSAKGIRVLINDLPVLKDQIYNQDVQHALKTIIEGAKRQSNAKAACIELEEKIQELLESVENEESISGELQAPKHRSDMDAMPPPKKRRSKRKKQQEDDDEDEENEDEDVADKSVGSNRSSKRGRRSCARSSKTDDSTVNSRLEEEYPGKTPNRRNPRRSSRISTTRSSLTPVPRRTPRRRLAYEARTTATSPELGRTRRSSQRIEI